MNQEIKHMASRYEQNSKRSTDPWDGEIIIFRWCWIITLAIYGQASQGARLPVVFTLKV